MAESGEVIAGLLMACTRRQVVDWTSLAGLEERSKDFRRTKIETVSWSWAWHGMAWHDYCDATFPMVSQRAYRLYSVRSND